MNWLDIVLIIWLLSSAFSGFHLGFLYKIVSLGATLIGLWFTTKYTGTVAGWFGGGLGATIFTFIFLISLVSHLAGILGKLVDRAFAIAKWIPFVGLANRLAGALVSVIITCIILSIALWIGNSMSQGGIISTAIAHSFIASLALKFSLIFLPLVADVLKTKVQS